MVKPEIRLKGFKGEWSATQLSQIAKFSKGHGYSKSDLCEQGTPIILYGRLYTNYSTEIDCVDTYVKMKEGSVLSKGGEIIIPASGETPEDIACASVVNRDGIILGGDLNIFSIDEKKYNPAFTALSITYGKVHNELAKYAQGKTVVHLHNAEISKATIQYPQGIEEQVALADYFKSLDSMIQGVTNKIASLKQMKQACLVSMFPQAGETTPRVRFKGFKGEWENVSFKDITYLSGTKNRDNLPLESYSISNEKGFVPQNEQFEQGGTMANADKRLYYIVTPDSFAYNPARINVGSIGYDDLDKDVIVSSLYVVFKTDDNTNNYFLNHWFKTPMFRNMIELYQEGGVRLYFFYDKLCQCHFRRPCLAEQEKIASFFTSLDKQISLQEARLEKLKQIKAACLDKMFV